MEMRVTENTITNEQIRKGYEDNLQGYIFISIQDNRRLVICENKTDTICDAKNFWEIINISVMDIEAENPKFKKCEYINNNLILEYDNRIIRIKTSK